MVEMDLGPLTPAASSQNKTETLDPHSIATDTPRAADHRKFSKPTSHQQTSVVGGSTLEAQGLDRIRHYRLVISNPETTTLIDGACRFGRPGFFY